MNDNIAEFLSSNNYAETTKRTYASILDLFITQVKQPESLTASGLVNFVQSQKGWERVEGNSRQCVALAATRMYLRWQYGMSHPAINAKIKRIRGKIHPTITKEKKDELLASFDRHSRAGARNLAMAAVWIQTGLRLSEICNLKQATVDTEHLRLYALVKGGKWRFGIYSEDTAAHIEHWKRFRENLNPQGGYLFINTFTGKQLTPAGVQSIVKQWGIRIDVHLTPHMFRRGFATQTAENGGNARSVMAGGGWDSEQMYNHYTKLFQLESLRKWLPDTSVSEKD